MRWDVEEESEYYILQSLFWCLWSWNTLEKLWPSYIRQLYRVLLEKTSNILETRHSIWTKIAHFSCLNEITHSTIALCIHVRLFKCYKTESFECWCAEIPLHKSDSSVVSALHRQNVLHYPSLVWMLAFFTDFQAKHSKELKSTTS